MSRLRVAFANSVVFLLLAVPSRGQADEPPSYSKHIQPFFAKYCVECHNDDDLKGGLSLESFAKLSEGGDTGLAVVAGKPDGSRLVLLVEGKAKPKMPPAKARQPAPTEVAVLRAWVAAGAKVDGAGAAATATPVATPNVPPRRAVPARIGAIAFCETANRWRRAATRM